MVSVEKSPDYAESSITIIGLTREVYGRPQYFLVNSDEGKTPELKFPGLRFRAAVGNLSLEDRAKERFEEQTGLVMNKSLGLRAIMPARSRHDKQWIFRNIFLGFVENVHDFRKPDGNRKVYMAEPGQGIFEKDEFVYSFGDAKQKFPLKWVISDNRIIARIATEILNHFDWEKQDSKWYKRIPVLTSTPLSSGENTPLGCGLAIASIMLMYQPSPYEQQQIILLKRKGDKYPGYAGGKIETLKSSTSLNLDPISCCAKEGAEEYGFDIQPRALICCTNTALDVPDSNSDKYYNSLVNYSFVAEPTNPVRVREALKNPKDFLEGKMESYVVESLDEHRDRIMQKELRMPDMPIIGEQFYKSSPGQKIPLTQFCFSGIV